MPTPPPDQPQADQRWLTIIGITPDGSTGLPQTARDALKNCKSLFASRRQLDLIPQHMTPNAERHPWPSPMMPRIHDLVEEKPANTVILASGDPLHWGIGQYFSENIPAAEMHIIPAPSIITLIAAAMAWPTGEINSLSLCSQPLHAIARHLEPGRKLALLPSTPREIAEIGVFLTNAGYGPSQVTILENLGHAEQRRTTTTAEALQNAENCAPLTSLAIQLTASNDTPRLTKMLTTTPGLPDEAFDHDGQMTRQTMRAITLAHLRPAYGELLWDIGSGSGSISIEWLRAGSATRACAIESNPERLARSQRNAEKLGVPHLELIDGRAPDCLEGLEAPDAIFIGGGLTTAGLLDKALSALRANGRLVANSVTIEGEAVLIAAYKSHGGQLSRIAMEEADPVGRFNGWRPKMPITQWVYHKSETD